MGVPKQSSARLSHNSIITSGIIDYTGSYHLLIINNIVYN